MNKWQSILGNQYKEFAIIISNCIHIYIHPYRKLHLSSFANHQPTIVKIHTCFLPILFESRKHIQFWIIVLLSVGLWPLRKIAIFFHRSSQLLADVMIETCLPDIVFVLLVADLSWALDTNFNCIKLHDCVRIVHIYRHHQHHNLKRFCIWTDFFPSSDMTAFLLLTFYSFTSFQF